MPNTRGQLLCEFHCHTTFSDGDLTLTETVDLYGTSGFDVLCITDHCVRGDDPWLTESPRPNHVQAANFEEYVKAIEEEAVRARLLYDLVVVPGLELTDHHSDPRHAAHAVALGLREFVGVDEGIELALTEASAAGAVVVAAHPYPLELARAASRGTARFAIEWASLRRLVHRFELVNRHEVFSWVAEAQLPYIASGDFHRLEHLGNWKTIVPCAKSEAAVVAYLRSTAPVHITRFQPELVGEALAA
jgi:predicted metal-dependent phosphoesterase TrpH